MNPLQLRDTTMEPNTRRLLQLTLDDCTKEEAVLDKLLKKRATDRRSWLEAQALWLRFKKHRKYHNRCFVGVIRTEGFLPVRAPMVGPLCV